MTAQVKGLLKVISPSYPLSHYTAAIGPCTLSCTYFRCATTFLIANGAHPLAGGVVEIVLVRENTYSYMHTAR